MKAEVHVTRLPKRTSLRRVQHDSDDHLQTNIDVETSAGLKLEILTDRALDIGPASFKGTPVGWTSGKQFRHPLDLSQNIWGERFVGGLIATCGLGNVGPSCIDGGVQYAQHGRIGGEAAEDVRVAARVSKGRTFFVVKGRVKDPGSNLQLYRTIVICDELPLFRLVDTVINEGESSEPVMVQYHCNFGRPTVAPGGSLEIPGASTTPRDPEAAEKLDTWPVIDAPVPGEQERVLRHQQAASSWASASVISPPTESNARRTICVRYDRRTLPWLWQWRLLSTGIYVIGLEPANCSVKPRSKARQQNRLPILDASERVTFRIEIGFSEGVRAAR